MPFPWSLALKAIPWSALLAQAPAMADTLRARQKADTARQAAASAAMEGALARLEALEAQTRAHSDLVTQLAQQTAALTTATEVLAARLRWLLGLAIGAAALAAVALVLAMLRG